MAPAAGPEVVDDAVDAEAVLDAVLARSFLTVPYLCHKYREICVYLVLSATDAEEEAIVSEVRALILARLLQNPPN